MSDTKKSLFNFEVNTVFNSFVEKKPLYSQVRPNNASFPQNSRFINITLNTILNCNVRLHTWSHTQ